MIMFNNQQSVELTIINQKPATTSRQVAMYFNKRHDNVLRDIENLDCSSEFTHLNFEVSEYKDPSGKTSIEYIIYRDGFTFLAMGFTGKRAAQFKEAYIYAFNEMEKKLQQPSQTALQQGSLKLNDILNAANPLKKTIVEITHTEQGDLVNVSTLEQSLTPEFHPQKPTQASTTAQKPLWISIIEMFFEEIDQGKIPEKMRQNMLITKEHIKLPTGKKEPHSCLFFRASNLVAFLRETPRFFDLINESGLYTPRALLAQLKKAGVLALNGKVREKTIPINPKIPLKTRRVSHLVAIDLVILERDYGIVIANSRKIAKVL